MAGCHPNQRVVTRGDDGAPIGHPRHQNLRESLEYLVAVGRADQALGNHGQQLELIDVGTGNGIPGGGGGGGGGGPLPVAIVPVTDVRKNDVQAWSGGPGTYLEPGGQRLVVHLEQRWLLQCHRLTALRFELGAGQLEIEKVLALQFVPGGMQESCALAVHLDDAKVGADREECVRHRLQSVQQLLAVPVGLHGR